MDQFTLLHVFDGKLMNDSQIYDSFNILVNGVMQPHEVARFDAYMYGQYHIYGDKLKAQKVAADYLKEHGFEILQAFINVIDFSSERGE